MKEELKEFDYKGLRLEGTYLKLKNKIDKIFGKELTNGWKKVLEREEILVWVCNRGNVYNNF